VVVGLNPGMTPDTGWVASGKKIIKVSKLGKLGTMIKLSFQYSDI
jgi:hypothetical protein